MVLLLLQIDRGKELLGHTVTLFKVLSNYQHDFQSSFTILHAIISVS